jgi:hypothetical protein
MPLALPPPVVGLGTGRSDRIVFGTRTSVPVGVDAVIEYNGLFMNNRKWLDTYLVTSIDGLADADVRDDREVNPDEDGETAFDALYGGRTIVLRGKLRCFDLYKLRDMEQAMKQAFGNIKSELPLIFHTLSPATDHLIYCKKNATLSITEQQTSDREFDRDFMITLRASNPRFLSLINQLSFRELGSFDFFSTDSIANYTFVSGGGSMAVSGGLLTPLDTSRKRFYPSNQLEYSDVEVMVEYKPSVTAGIHRLFARYLDDDNYLYGVITIGGDLQIWKHDGGVDTRLDSGSTPAPGLTAGNFYWLRFRTNGNEVTMEFMNPDPSPIVPIPPQMNIRPVPVGPSSASTQITLSAGDIIKFGADIRGKAGLDLSPGSTACVYDNLSVTPFGMDGIEVLTPTNQGNYRSMPQIAMVGPITNPVILNNSNGKVLSFSGTVPAGERWTYDLAAKTLTDQDGINKFGKLDIVSDLDFGLEAGTNNILMSGAQIGPGYVGAELNLPSIQFLYQHAWR